MDSATEDFLSHFSKMFASISHLSIPEQRETIKKMFSIPEHQLEPVARVEDKVINGINLRLYFPKDPHSTIVYFHRGGWVYGSIVESESICRRLANETGSTVVAVEYRLSPEHKFPIPLEDCYNATKWVAQNFDKVIVCGESAGGNLAAAVALMARDKKEFEIAGQLLLYPVLTCTLEKKYYDESPDKSLLSYENMQFFINAYLSSPKEAENDYASPLKSKNLANLPPCFIVTAEHDALKHEGKLYSEKIGGEVRCYPGVIHGFLDLPLADATKQQAIKDIGLWVKGLQ